MSSPVALWGDRNHSILPFPSISGSEGRSHTPPTVLWTLLCFLENLDIEDTLEVERPSLPGIKHVMQFLPLGSSFLDKGNILDEVLLISKGGCFAFTVNALWFEAEISHYFLQHQGMPPEAHFHQPQSLTSCVLLQRRTERKAPKAEEQILDFSRQYRPFFNNAFAAPLKITGVGPRQVFRCHLSSKKTVQPSIFFK